VDQNEKFKNRFINFFSGMLQEEVFFAIKKLLASIISSTCMPQYPLPRVANESWMQQNIIKWEFLDKIFVKTLMHFFQRPQGC